MKSAFVFHIYLAKKKKKKFKKQIQKEDITEDRGTWIQERPVVGPNRPERGKTNSQ